MELSLVNQPIRTVISLDVRSVVHVGMLNGGRSKKSLENLFRLMSLHSIYPPDALRVLRIINGRCCEFCAKNLCYFLRPQFGVFACWSCLHTNKLRTYNDTGEQEGLSSRWHKVVYLPNRGWFIKQLYLAHRKICFFIFEHESILAYPTRNRWLFPDGNDYHTTTKRGHSNITSKDAHEIMWNRLTRDSCQELIGPFFCKSDVSRLIDYIKLYDGVTPSTIRPVIESFLRSEIEQMPNKSSYEPFLLAFNQASNEANHKQMVRKTYVVLYSF